MSLLGRGTVSSAMTMRGLVALIAAAVAAALFVASPCLSQSITGGSDYVTDVIVGKNTKGPYSLSWTDIDTDSLSVVINGRSLKRNKDYRIDPAKGVLSFDSVLINDAIVRVSYRTIPGKSKRAGGQLNIPITLDLLQGQDASMQVTGLYAQDDPKNPDAAKTVVGLGGERKWAAGKANSLLLLSQRHTAGGSGDQGDFWSRAGFKFDGDTSVGALKFSGSVLHSGSDFAGANEYGLGLGKEARSFAAEYAPGGPLSARAVYEQAEDTAGKTKGTRSLIHEQSLVYSPGDATKLSLTHSLRETAAAAEGSEKKVDSNLIRLDQRLGARASATASFEDASISAGGAQDQVRTQSLQLTGSPSANLSLRGALSQKNSELHGEEQQLSAGFTAAPNKQVKLDVDVGALENDNVGEQTRTDVKLTTSPIPQLAVQAAYSGADSSKLGQTSSANLKFQAKPTDNIELAGSFVDSAQNDECRFQRDLTLSSSPTDSAKLSALFSQKGINDWDDVTRGAVLELTPASHTKLGAGYTYTEAGAQTLRVRDYSVSTRPWSFFSATGSLRDRDIEHVGAPDTASITVSLAPVRYFTISGDYQSNPEDKKGVVQHYRAANVGLSTRIGSVGLSGAFTEKDEYQIDRMSDEKRFGLEMPAFGNGRLNTGYKIGRFFGAGEAVSQTYSLGYQHSIGSDFSLSLTGYYTRWLQDRMPVPEKTEVSAEASLGIRF